LNAGRMGFFLKSDLGWGMFGQLLTGATMICLAILVQGAFIVSAMRQQSRIAAWAARRPALWRNTAVTISVTLWVMLSHSIVVWMWAFLYLFVGAFDGLEPALYFSLVSFTTLGFGDIILPIEFRLLSGLTAANGMIAFGLSTAFLAEYLLRLRKSIES